jgi:rubrerythrin
MDECCIEFCKNLDEWIQDEENDEKKYHTWAKQAKEKQPYISTILESISKDEGKHAIMLADVAMQVCSEPMNPLSEKLKHDRGGFDF